MENLFNDKKLMRDLYLGKVHKSRFAMQLRNYLAPEPFNGDSKQMYRVCEKSAYLFLG